MSSRHDIEVAPLPRLKSLPEFEESAPTFAENAAGKALHYSRSTDGIVMADDSGLVVDALGGAPGVQSARYAGPDASDAARVAKLLREMSSLRGAQRHARFICVNALAERGRALAIVSDSVEGEILTAAHGSGGFGYDPVFCFPPLGKTFAELASDEKNQHSHRGKAFRRILEWLEKTRG